jgi:hypothetical protein
MPSGFSDEVVTDAEGNGIISGKITQKGEYRFQVACTVERDLPADLPEAVRDVIRRQLGTKVPLRSNPVNFVLRVDEAGVEAPQLTLNIEPPKDDKWIVGIPYTKAIYVGGAQTGVVNFSVSDGRFKLTKDIGKVNLTWDNPTVTQAPINVTVYGNANRGAAPALERASLSFTISVAPPRWDPEPGDVAFWDVPFTFASGIRGLDVNRYTVQILANGNIPVKTLSAVEYPFTLKPDRSWTNLVFKAFSSTQTEMLRKEIPVKKPVPPQVKWTGSTWQGNEYVIRFTSQDIGGTDVTIDNCTVVQPEGITSRVEPRRGKQFTLTVLNLKATRPSAIKIKITVSGIGGSRPDQIMQSILY